MEFGELVVTVASLGGAGAGSSSEEPQASNPHKLKLSSRDTITCLFMVDLVPKSKPNRFMTECRIIVLLVFGSLDL
jgi:hypothetical protein